LGLGVLLPHFMAPGNAAEAHERDEETQDEGPAAEFPVEPFTCVLHYRHRIRVYKAHVKTFLAFRGNFLA